MVFVVVTLVTAASLLLFMWAIPEESTSLGPALALLFLFSPAVGWIGQAIAASAARAKAMPERRSVAIYRLKHSVEKHRSALSKNLATAKRTNDYGAVIEDNTFTVLTEFFVSTYLDLDALPAQMAFQIVADQMQTYAELDKLNGFDPLVLPETGQEFEHWVAAAMRRFGWDATVTIGSGDQGIDVICSRDGMRLGLQCKLYAGSIGNKAVQEANAGKAFYKLHEAGVITNSVFTSSAKALAQSAGIHLFSHHDIPSIHEKIPSKA